MPRQALPCSHACVKDRQRNITSSDYELCAQRAKKPDLAELSEKSAALLEQTHVPFHSLTGSADEKDSEPVRLLDQAETELAGELAPLPAQAGPLFA